MVMADEPKQKSGGLSIQTLLISAAAAVVAATIVPMFWEHGTIFATAMTPVIVALVSEGLRKPVQHVSAVAPRVARRSGTGAAVRRFEPAAARTRDPERVGARGEGPERFEPLPEHLRDDAPSMRDDDPYGLRKATKTPAAAEDRADHRRARVRHRRRRGHGLRAGAVRRLGLQRPPHEPVRRPEVLHERDEKDKADAHPTPTATPQDGEATPTPTATATAEPSETPSPAPTATATPVQQNVTITPAPTP